MLLSLLLGLQGAVTRPVDVLDYDLTVTLPDAGKTIEDRKSTRLNSSH